jgi:site-specific recombinase XerD
MLDHLQKTAERFWALVDKRGPTECWPWRGARNAQMPGQFSITIAPHTQIEVSGRRVAWMLGNQREIPENRDARVSCRTALCCNPAHIYLAVPRRLTSLADGNVLGDSMEDFLQDLTDQRFSPLTIPTYRTTLAAFRAWLAQNAPEVRAPADLTRTHLRQFTRWLIATPTDSGAAPAPATVDRWLYALRSWLGFLHAETDYPAPAPQAVRIPRHDPALIRVIPTPDQVRAIIELCPWETVVGRRNRAILLTFFSAGLRIAELCSLDRSQVPIAELGTRDLFQLPVKGKGRKVRGIFLNREAQRALKAMLDDRTDADPALFIHYRPGKATAEDHSLRVSPRAIQLLMHDVCEKGGLPAGISPHALRHAFAVDCFKGGADIRAVQEMLGHTSILTTQRYLQLDNNHLQESYRKRQSWQDEPPPPEPTTIARPPLRVLTRFGKEIAG